ncbi:21360_t:CDS:1, partial [Gigaspora rosea]
RTFESCGAVQAGHTVISIEDIILNISEPILSSPSEILLSNINNNLLPNYPNDEHIQQHNSTHFLSCYNIFLAYYNIPPLKSKQTIRSFLQYFDKISTEQYQYYPIQLLFDATKEEAHIYLPTENITEPGSSDLLPRHTPILELNKYYKYPLKSNNNRPSTN